MMISRISSFTYTLLYLHKITYYGTLFFTTVLFMKKKSIVSALSRTRGDSSCINFTLMTYTFIYESEYELT